MEAPGDVQNTGTVGIDLALLVNAGSCGWRLTFLLEAEVVGRALED